MFEQKQIEAAEERRKQREAKQYGKQVQLAKQKERNADKKRQIEQISKLRKQREKSVSGFLRVGDRILREGRRKLV